MYQTSIRNKKKSSNFNKVANNNYAIDKEYEVFAYVMKVLGNCRVLVLCDNGTEAIGVIRGSMRRFNKRVLIETGDIVAVSMREFQTNKVDIVHKYNAEQCKVLISNNEISDTLINAYNKVGTSGTSGAGGTACLANDADNILFDDSQHPVEEAVNGNGDVFVFNSEDEAEASEADEADEAEADCEDI
jgi:translation initiation factor 1A